METLKAFWWLVLLQRVISDFTSSSWHETHPTSVFLSSKTSTRRFRDKKTRLTLYSPEDVLTAISRKTPVSSLYCPNIWRVKRLLAVYIDCNENLFNTKGCICQEFSKIWKHSIILKKKDVQSKNVVWNGSPEHFLKRKHLHWNVLNNHSDVSLCLLGALMSRFISEKRSNSICCSDCLCFLPQQLYFFCFLAKCVMINLRPCKRRRKKKRHVFWDKCRSHLVY